MSKGYFDNCMTVEELEQEHKRLVVQLHPDRNPNDPDATARFQEMQQQYEERKAELAGDYTKARKGRERREREERERRERERKERERRKVEQAVEAARLNRQKSHREWKAGDYVYARVVNHKQTVNWGQMTCEDLLWVVAELGVRDECVVKIEAVVDEAADSSILGCGYALYKGIPDGGPWGGWEVLQTADPASGVRKSKRVAKVIMFRSPKYCLFANPMGDQTFSDYYMTVGYGDMFSDRLGEIRARMAEMERERLRVEAEKKARLIAEQKPLIEEWQDKLISISAALSGRERETVAVSNLKTVLKGKFPGVTFKVSPNKWGGMYDVKWEDGPTDAEVQQVTALFKSGELTPWKERFGSIMIAACCTERRMSVLTKAKILQQLGSVTEAFGTSAIDEDVTVSEFDWMMLHLLVGVNVSDPDARLCMSTLNADGTRSVSVSAAVRFVFQHSSYAKVSQKAQKAQKKAA